MKLFIIIGAINAFLSVALGAFGAHGLEGKVEGKYMDNWQTAVQYQMFHAIGILIVGLLMSKMPDSSLLNWSGWLMLFGIIFFSGSLYVLALTKISVLGAITPIGGVAFLAGWVLMVIFAVKHL
ncbi:uncharacterized membrane protein YgdD (TMEM256/DUF423 family) [Cytobacillus horneckiae]|uniref:DUF423 domain-containing protein n=1 Tax=Cytobacillus horneckiae TaxID=549687 RepID=A0A2N0ZDR4_9BACI|nr:DUF423 domain-containing protein [Cytobacillus horneckiae]NRG44326.1 DUF423 domain-containing protein [Bacillus sp. CRN 9]MBN6884984.1 DUF423 domain-containing protein [Cytobacillus horneckiae]MCM3179269.1 DUF423 domain-containing protein [Cytobacillus horneckiae]MEC1154491.1 DUF423 domain-containing protein [Cytobacillus horneckiae]MED2937826.1 DUF423 domain-containing protein [Cytobacillus horneckiae]